MKEYKILTQKDKWFSGKFNPEKLEEVLNTFAQDGWSVKTITTATIATLMSKGREEIIVIFEREKPI